ncbi:MAG: hypothetical protein K1X44_01795 [Alphaproteobacteria bacterium]|nr:hypothetical protein [Alphaproteobacteria bacterium]
MNQSLSSGSFTIERHYDVSPQKVFSVWSDPIIKAQWFIGPETWSLIKRELNFKVWG